MRRLLPLLALIALVACVPAARGATPISTEQARVPADAYGERTAWSSFDPVARVHRLVTLEDGQAVRTGARASRHPFFLDLGPGPDGEPVAVYPRCSAEGACDVFLYDFGTQRERRLGVSTKAASESLPSIWRGRVAFARRAGGVSQMWIADLNGKNAVPVPGGRVSGPSGPIALELRGSRAAFVWSRRGSNGFTQTDLFAYRAGRITWLDRTGSGGAGTSTFVTPEIRGRWVHYGRPTTGRGMGNQLRRARVDGKRVEHVRAPFTGITTAVWLTDRFLLARALEGEGPDPESDCRAPGTDPSASVCRLVIGDRVTRWRRLPAGSA